MRERKPISVLEDGRCNTGWNEPDLTCQPKPFGLINLEVWPDTNIYWYLEV